MYEWRITIIGGERWIQIRDSGAVDWIDLCALRFAEIATEGSTFNEAMSR